MPHYYEMDKIGQELFRTQPADFGIQPRDSEMYIGLAVRDYFMGLEQEQRLLVLKNLVTPQRVDILIDADHEVADIRLTEADISRHFLGMIIVYAVQMVLQELGKESAVDNPHVDKELAAGLRNMTAQVLRSAYDEFEVDKMSQSLEAFIREVYTVVVRG